jgi:hypothetical protein
VLPPADPTLVGQLTSRQPAGMEDACTYRHRACPAECARRMAHRAVPCHHGAWKIRGTELVAGVDAAYRVRRGAAYLWGRGERCRCHGTHQHHQPQRQSSHVCCRVHPATPCWLAGSAPHAAGCPQWSSVSTPPRVLCRTSPQALLVRVLSGELLTNQLRNPPGPTREVRHGHGLCILQCWRVSDGCQHKCLP